MGIVLDLIIIGILAISTWLGYKKGLTKSLLKIFSFVIAIVVSVVLFRPIANIVVSQTDFVDIIQNTISSTFKSEEKEFLEEGGQENNKEESIEHSIFYSYIENKIIESASEAKDYAIEVASKEIAIGIINIAVFIILFIAIRVALIFVKALADLITKLPVVKQFDETGGGIFGFLRASVIILFLFTIISISAPLIPGNIITSIFENSILAKLIYENNFIIKMIFNGWGLVCHSY